MNASLVIKKTLLRSTCTPFNIYYRHFIYISTVVFCYVVQSLKSAVCKSKKLTKLIKTPKLIFFFLFGRLEKILYCINHALHKQKP